jgi:hypothetical protein
LPNGKFGLDIIALIGTLRYREHRSIPEIHRVLQERRVAIAQRTVTYLVERYEELLALRLADQTRLKESLKQQGHVILALDGLQPYKNHDVLWVLRDTVSGEVLLARSLDSARQEDLAELVREVKDALPVPIQGVISDAQRPIRLAVQKVLPGVPHQLCQFHYLKEAAQPIVEADHHAKTELKKYTRGVREIERSMATHEDQEAKSIRGYCLAVRSALSDQGKPPLLLPGLLMHERLKAILGSLERVEKKRGCQPSWSSLKEWCGEDCLPQSSTGRHSKLHRGGLREQLRCLPTRSRRARQGWKSSIECCLRRC